MMTLLKWLGILVLAAVLAVAGFFITMRFHDGPLEIVSGGPFTTGVTTPAPGEWSFLADRATIEFQTLDPATSRTVWLAVHEGRLFLISGYMNTGYGKIWKQWPHYIEDDDRIVLRIDGKLYEQRLERMTEGPDVLPVLKEFGRKYGFQANDIEQIERGDAWLFEVLPRDSSVAAE